jgi:hypothetical protein
MQSAYMDDQRRYSASLAPEWPEAVEPHSSSFNNEALASGRPSIVRRIFGALARFLIAVLIGVCATLAWQSYGDTAREMLSTQVPWLRWVSTTTLTRFGQESAQNAAVSQSAPMPQATAPAATTAPELAQLEPMARDLAAMRRSLEQLTVKQEQMAENIATLQAAEQEIRQKMASRPQALSDQPRKPPKPPVRLSPAQSPPVPPPPPVAQSPSQSRSDSP